MLMIFKVTLDFAFSSSLDILIKFQYPEGLQESIALTSCKKETKKQLPKFERDCYQNSSESKRVAF